MYVVKGDDTSIPVTLKKKVNGTASTFAIDAGATIKAVITNTDGNTTLTDVVTINNLATGTDLANSLIIVEFTSVQTSAISTIGQAMLEIQVDDSGKLTWFTPVIIKNGNIS